MDVVEILTDDYKEMVELIGRIESTSDLNRRRDLADTVIAEVMRHAVAEDVRLSCDRRPGVGMVDMLLELTGRQSK